MSLNFLHKNIFAGEWFWEKMKMDEFDEDESYLPTSSGNPVYIPSVAKTNNFSKLSVCCRNKTARPN